MKIYYPAWIHKGQTGSYGISFPDFPGCVSVCSEKDDIYHMAGDALQFHINGLLKDGEELPEPSTWHLAFEESDNDIYTVIMVVVEIQANDT